MAESDGGLVNAQYPALKKCFKKSETVALADFRGANTPAMATFKKPLKEAEREIDIHQL